jgi:tape measure domain-containing protein
MANSTQEAIRIAAEGIAKLKVEMTGLNAVILDGATKLNTMLSADTTSFKELNVLLKQVETTTKKTNEASEKKIVVDGKVKTQQVQLAKTYQSLNAQREKEIKEIQRANRGRLREADAIERNKNALKKQKNAVIEMSRPYNKLIAQQKLARKTLEDLTVSQGKNSLRTKNAQKQYDRLTAKVNQANIATRNFAKGGLRSTVLGLRNLLGAFGIIGGVQLFASTISSAFQLTTALDSIGFSMRAIIKDSEELAQTQIFLTKITNNYGAELVTTTNRYVKFRAAAMQAGMSANATQDIFGTMTKAAGVLGLKTDELTGIFLALEQMISKGKITTEELRRQLGERLPGAMDIMANSLGVTTAELDKMLRAGEVITKDVLPAFARQVEKAFGLDKVDKVQTLRAAITRLKNSWTTLVDDFAKGGTQIQSLTSLIDYVADNFRTLASVLIIGIKYLGIYKLAMFAVNIVTNTAIKSNVLYRISLIAMRGGISKTIIALRALRIATSTSGIGLFLVALGASYEIFMAFSDGAKEATKKMTLFNDQVDRYNNNYKTTKANLEAHKKGYDQLLLATNNQGKIIDEVEAKVSKYANNDFERNSEHVRFAKEMIRNEKKLSKEEVENALNRYKFNAEQKKYIFNRMGEYKALDEAIDTNLEFIKKKNKEEEEGNKEANKYLIGSIAYYEKQISLAKDAIQNSTLSSDGYIKQSKAIEDATEKLKALKKALGIRDEVKPLKLPDLKDGSNLSEQQKALLKFIESLKEVEKTSEIEIPFKYTKDAKKIEELIEKLKETELKDIFSEVTDTFADMFDIDMSKFDFLFEKGKNSVEDWAKLSKELIGSVLDASLQSYEIELQQAQIARDTTLNNDLASAEQKEAARAQFDEKERDINTRKAKEERKNNLIKIAVDTAVGIVSALGNPFKIAAIVALGLSQAAIVASQPLPKFEKGTQNSPEGMATTDEKGAEIHTDRLGNIKDLGSNKGARNKYLEKGDKIFTADQSKNMLEGFDANHLQRAIFDMNMVSNGNVLNDKAVDRSLLNEVGGLRKDIDKMGLRIQKMASRPISVNNKIELKDNRAY